MKKELLGLRLHHFPQGARLAYAHEITHLDTAWHYPDLETYCLSQLGYMLLEYLLDEEDCLTHEVWVIESTSGVGFVRGFNEANTALYELENDCGDLEWLNFETLLTEVNAWSKGEEVCEVIAVMETKHHVTSYHGNTEVDYVDLIYHGLLDMEKIVTMTNFP